MKILSLIAVLSLSILVGIFFMRSTWQQQPDTDYRLLPLGDSYTIGEGTTPRLSWPAVVADMLKRNDTITLAIPENPAVTGYTTQDLINEELPLIDTINPTHVTVMIGANDVVQGVSEDQFRTNLQTILDTVLQTVPANRILLVTIPNFLMTPIGSQFDTNGTTAGRIKTFNANIQEEAATRAIMVVDLYPLSTELATDSAMIARDGLHPSARQYGQWAQTIYPFIRKQF